ncbi:MAG: hypothetical protein R2726_08740 [Acidimicrobiales bacterium]
MSAVRPARRPSYAPRGVRAISVQALVLVVVLVLVARPHPLHGLPIEVIT